MSDKRVAIATLGCKVNQYDSAVLAGIFQKKGYRLVKFTEAADVYVVNTCSVTHLGERKSRQMIRRAVKANPTAIIAVTGCYAQISPEEVQEMPGVDLLVGTGDRYKIAEMVEKLDKTGVTVNAVNSANDSNEFKVNAAAPYTERARAFLKIQDGCNNFCTYCIVPYARGRVRSLPQPLALSRAAELAAAGFKEIVLTGIHTGSYGQDLPDKPTLAGLLQSLAEIPGIPRIRLGSIEPNDITLELIEVLSRSEVFCKHLHIPLQSGDDRVLAKMGRKYTAYEYSALIGVLKENIPDLGLTTDVIVGFPGETEDSFAYTLNMLRKCSFSKLHVFKYSPRAGTPAAAFPGQVPARVKEERSRALIDLSDAMAAEFAASFMGRMLEVLVESRCKTNKGLFEGHAGNYQRVSFPADEAEIGAIMPVRIEGWDSQGLTGRLVRTV